MKVTKQQIKADIQALLADLRPFGYDNTERIAMLLRQDDSDDPAFPSGAYIRLMLSKSDKPDPSERFCARFYDLKAWVEQELSDGAVGLIAKGKALTIPDTYTPQDKIRFVTLPSTLELRGLTLIENENGLRDALVYVPADWIGQCQAENCGQFYLRRSNQSKYHSAKCRTYEQNRRRRERRKNV